MKTPKFKPHFNRELGFKKYYTEKEYRSAMKAAGVEPYQGEIKRPEPKPYEASEWAKGMHKDIKDRNGRPPGDRFIAELAKRGYTREAYEKARRLANER